MRLILTPFLRYTPIGAAVPQEPEFGRSRHCHQQVPAQRPRSPALCLPTPHPHAGKGVLPPTLWPRSCRHLWHLPFCSPREEDDERPDQVRCLLRSLCPPEGEYAVFLLSIIYRDHIILSSSPSRQIRTRTKRKEKKEKKKEKRTRKKN